MTITAMLFATAVVGQAPANAAGKSGGTLTVGVAGLPPSQGNPYREGPGTPGVHTYAAVFDALVRVDGKGAAKPKLALSWKPISKKSWRFNLRKGVKFSNGEDFDAAAVKATFDYLVSEAGRRTVIGSTELPTVTGARVVNRYTVDIYTSTVDAILPAKLAAVYIVAPKAWKDAGEDIVTAKPVGTGPFKFDSVTTTRIELSAFKGSWRKPKVNKMVIIPLADAASRLQALQSGQVNMIAVYR